MADAAARHSAMAGVQLPARAGRVTVSDAGPATRYSFRGSAAAAENAGRAFGAALPLRPLQSASSAGRHALWLGPDEWLLLAPAGDEAIIERAIRSACAVMPFSLVDVSHRQIGLLVSGPRAADTLMAECPLDLDPVVFPAGTCVRTIFAKAELIVWRTAPDAFRIEIARSFWPYVVGFLTDIIRDPG